MYHSFIEVEYKNFYRNGGAERNYFNADKDLKFKTCVALIRKEAYCR